MVHVIARFIRHFAQRVQRHAALGDAAWRVGVERYSIQHARGEVAKAAAEVGQLPRVLSAAERGELI